LETPPYARGSSRCWTHLAIANTSASADKTTRSDALLLDVESATPGGVIVMVCPSIVADKDVTCAATPSMSAVTLEVPDAPTNPTRCNLRLGFGDWGSGFRIQGTGFRVLGFGYRVEVPGSRVEGPGFRVRGVPLVEVESWTLNPAPHQPCEIPEQGYIIQKPETKTLDLKPLWVPSVPSHCVSWSISNPASWPRVSDASLLRSCGISAVRLIPPVEGSKSPNCKVNTHSKELLGGFRRCGRARPSSSLASLSLSLSLTHTHTLALQLSHTHN